MYIHERAEWPNFEWDSNKLETLLAGVRHRQGRLIGRMQSLGFALQTEASVLTLTEDVLRTSEIEGQFLDPEMVHSSVARQLGLDVAGLKTPDRTVEGIVEVMLDATRNYQQPLTAERLFGWQAALFPTGRSGSRRIRVGCWRDDELGPMQVISGPIGRENVHYEAPAAARLETEAASFLDWFENKVGIDPVMKAGLAHLWFVTLHPFEDGNGRIARAIADLALARSEDSPRRFYSVSSQIRANRKDYYSILEFTQKGSLEVTPWLEWFLGCVDRAISEAERTLAAVIFKARVWDALADKPVNPRQKKVMNRLLDGFDGKLKTSKWSKLAMCSQDTALRDITELLELGVLQKDPGGGRSTSYSLNPDFGAPRVTGS